jgi:hypothetical protein
VIRFGPGFTHQPRMGHAHRARLRLTYPSFHGFGCAKKAIDSSPAGRTPRPPQGEPYNVRKTSATARTKCGLETE